MARYARRLLAVIAAVVVLIGGASVAAWAATINVPSTSPFNVPRLDNAGNPDFFTVTATGYGPGTPVFIEQCDGSNPNVLPPLVWNPNEHCDPTTGNAPVTADANGVATFPATNVNTRLSPFKGENPQGGLFNCLGPDDPDLANGNPNWHVCQVRVTQNLNASNPSTDAYISIILPDDFANTTTTTSSTTTSTTTTTTTTLPHAVAPNDQQINQQVIAGQLVLSCSAPGTPGYPALTCPLVQLPNITLNGTQQTSTGKAGTSYVTDGRGDPTLGWSLTTYMVPTSSNTNGSCATSADFCNSTISPSLTSNSNAHIPASNLSIGGIVCKPYTGNPNPAPAAGPGGSYGSSAPGLGLCTATAGQGGGTFTMDGNLTLTVPANAAAGLYQGTVEYLLT
jgi:hypothetical protein